MYVQERDCWIIWLSDSDEGIPSLLSGRYFYTCLANIPLWFCVCPCHGNWFGLDLSLLALQFISITAHHCFSYLLNPPPAPRPGVAQRVKHLPVMQETQVRSLGWEDPLEKEMATHSSILAWRIPWTEEPGGLQSTGSQSRTRLSDFTSLHFLT